MEKVYENIYRIGVPLTGNPLKELNSYLIRGTDRDLLIDTGFRREECYQVLSEALKEAGTGRERLDIFLTHLHSDHTGLAPDIAGENSRIFIHKADLDRLKVLRTPKAKTLMNYRFLEEGMPEDLVDRIHARNPAAVDAPRAIDDRFIAISDGHIFDVGGYRLTSLHMPGHSPGQMMLWLESEGIMFTGDHVLFDITPNITTYGGVQDSLGDYLDSLARAGQYPVKISLPGHRKPGDYHERIARLQIHHEKRVAEAFGIVGSHPGLAAYDIAGHMTWKIHAKGKQGPASWEEFPETQKWFAMGECMSHLDYLRLRGKVRRERSGGVWRYEVV